MIIIDIEVIHWND